MPRTILTLLLAGVALLEGCASMESAPAAPGFDPAAAVVAVYLERLPADAAGLGVELSGIAAVREEGGPVPLRLERPLSEARGTGPPRLVACGTVPPGRYHGFEVSVREASLEGEEGTVPLRVPEAPTPVAFPFTLSPRGGVVSEWRLDLKAALAGGDGFTPEFAASAPSRPPTGLVGLASAGPFGTVLTFDRRSGRVTGVTPVGSDPRGIAIDALRRRAYVAVGGDDAIAVVDIDQASVIDRRPMRAGDAPREPALTPDGRTLLVANEGSASVSVFDAQGLVESSRVEVAESPVSVVVDRQGKRAYVSCRRGNQVVVLDLGPTAVRAAGSIAAEREPFRAQINRAGDRLYIAQQASPHLLVAEIPGFSILERPFVGERQAAVKVDPRTDRLYLARRGTGIIEVFDPLSLLAIDRFDVPTTPSFLTIDREENRLVAVLPESGEVRFVGLLSRRVDVTVDGLSGAGYVALVNER